MRLFGEFLSIWRIYCSRWNFVLSNRGKLEKLAPGFLLFHPCVQFNRWVSRYPYWRHLIVASASCILIHIIFDPVIHLDVLLNSDRGIPRVPSSAGFRGPGQYFHWLAWVLSKISATLWITKICCRLAYSCIHWSAFVLPIHICVELMSILCSLRMNFARLAPKTAARSSNLVIACCFTEATRAFPSTKALLICRLALLLYTK